MSSLYVVRHAEPARTGVLLGRSDPPLSDRGRQQAESLKIDAALFASSTLRRAVESAEICARGADVVYMPDLDEISLGDWDGLAWVEIEKRWPELAARKLDDWLGVTPPGGEPWTDFTRRVDRALAEICRQPRHVAVFAHLTVNAWIAHRLCGADPLQFNQQYAEYSVYVF